MIYRTILTNLEGNHMPWCTNFSRETREPISLPSLAAVELVDLTFWRLCSLMLKAQEHTWSCSHDQCHRKGNKGNMERQECSRLDLIPENQALMLCNRSVPCLLSIMMNQHGLKMFGGKPKHGSSILTAIHLMSWVFKADYSGECHTIHKKGPLLHVSYPHTQFPVSLTLQWKLVDLKPSHAGNFAKKCQRLAFNVDLPPLE